MRKLIAVSVMILGAFQLPAFAQQNGDPGKKHEKQNSESQKNAQWTGVDKKFLKLDRNRDGYISKDEWDKNPKGFNRIDVDHDGRISVQEWQMYRQQREPKSSSGK